MKITYEHFDPQSGHFGQTKVTMEFEQEEVDFVNTQYPREGFCERIFLERIVEKFNPTATELVYGWMALMDRCKNGPNGHFIKQITEKR